jgi:hypothetical protein
MPSAGFETSTPATKRPQTYALDRAATEVGHIYIYIYIYRERERERERGRCYTLLITENRYKESATGHDPEAVTPSFRHHKHSS